MKRAFLILLLVFTAVCMSGCSLTKRKSQTSTVPTKPVQVKSLKSGTIYVMHEDTATGEKTCYATYYNDVSNTDPAVFWFREDIGAIPTVYEGDKLIYWSEKPLSVNYKLKRYRYMGYTIGICGIRRAQTGQYYFNTGEKTESLSKKSDAAKLIRLNSEATVLRSVGNVTKLGKANFGLGGIVSGLEKNAVYKCVVYTGSVKHEYDLTSNNIALTYWKKDEATAVGYKYLDGNIVSINIPKDLQSGYYRIGSSGMFRYVKAGSFNEDTDFNVPNNITVASNYKDNGAGDTSYSKETENGATDKKIYGFKVEIEQETTVQITYDDDKDGKTLPDPSVKIIGDSFVITMEKAQGENKFYMKKNLPIGSYTIEITGLNGREVHVMIG